MRIWARSRCRGEIIGGWEIEDKVEDDYDGGKELIQAGSLCYTVFR
jgi:hypothetical protein